VVLARPLRWRAREHLAGVGPGGQQRVVAEGVGVAVGGALVVVAVDLAHGGVQVHGHRPITGTPPAAHARVSSCSVSRSSWRTWPKVKARRKVPRVEGP
jgi:hypothetical protein